jgi:hypothetical protein
VRSSFHVFADHFFECKQLSVQRMLGLSPRFTGPTAATTNS